jgi:membrane-associated protease RseP (regulator of RpoE activity)
MSELNFSIPDSVTGSTIEYAPPLPEPVGRAPRRRYWLHFLLLAATAFTTLVMGARMQYNFDHNLPALSFSDDSIPYFPAGWFFSHPARMWAGWPFAATVMLFFLAHEMGHYLCCRYYGINATLPFFIPVPTPIGTMGAVILIRSRIRSRLELFDVGIAGPIAGFVVACVAMVISLGWSKVMPHGYSGGDYELGFPLIFELAHRALGMIAPDHAANVLPLQRVLLHPTALAAWVGMYATALNLLPSGQLDGGHIVYALVPRAHRAISWTTVAALAYLGRFNHAWWVWGALITIMNVLTYRHQQAPEFPELPANRWLLALLGIAMLGLTFTVSPFKAN